MESVLRALDKEFSLNANYAKGHGDLFYEWMLHNHPDALLLAVERASGSRQDLEVEGAGLDELARGRRHQEAVWSKAAPRHAATDAHGAKH